VNTVARGLLLAGLHVVLLLAITGRYALDRARLPRVWARAAPVDPHLPIRGRYVRMNLLAHVPPEGIDRQRLPPRFRDSRASFPAEFRVEGQRLVAAPAGRANAVRVSSAGPFGRDLFMVEQPVAFFIPERAADPSQLGPGEQLWVEVSVPPRGLPRPIRLGVRRGGAEIEPIAP
jgi:hypothetical protein